MMADSYGSRSRPTNEQVSRCTKQVHCIRYVNKQQSGDFVITSNVLTRITTFNKIFLRREWSKRQHWGRINTHIIVVIIIYTATVVESRALIVLMI